jgi:hypothetical protein
MDRNLILYKLQKYQTKLENGTGDLNMYNAKIEFYENLLGGGGKRIRNFLENNPITRIFKSQCKKDYSDMGIMATKNNIKFFIGNIVNVLNNNINPTEQKLITKKGLENYIEYNLIKIKKQINFLDNDHDTFLSCYKSDINISKDDKRLKFIKDFKMLKKQYIRVINCIISQIYIGLRINNENYRKNVTMHLLDSLISLIDYNIFSPPQYNQTSYGMTVHPTILTGGGEKNNDIKILTRICNNLYLCITKEIFDYTKLKQILNNVKVKIEGEYYNITRVLPYDDPLPELPQRSPDDHRVEENPPVPEKPYYDNYLLMKNNENRKNTYNNMWIRNTSVKKLVKNSKDKKDQSLYDILRHKKKPMYSLPVSVKQRVQEIESQSTNNDMNRVEGEVVYNSGPDPEGIYHTGNPQNKPTYATSAKATKSCNPIAINHNRLKITNAIYDLYNLYNNNELTIDKFDIINKKFDIIYKNFDIFSKNMEIYINCINSENITQKGGIRGFKRNIFEIIKKKFPLLFGKKKIKNQSDKKFNTCEKTIDGDKIEVFIKTLIIEIYSIELEFYQKEEDIKIKLDKIISQIRAKISNLKNYYEIYNRCIDTLNTQYTTPDMVSNPLYHIYGPSISKPVEYVDPKELVFGKKLVFGPDSNSTNTDYDTVKPPSNDGQYDIVEPPRYVLTTKRGDPNKQKLYKTIEELENEKFNMQPNSMYISADVDATQPQIDEGIYLMADRGNNPPNKESPYGIPVRGLNKSNRPPPLLPRPSPK